MVRPWGCRSLLGLVHVALVAPHYFVGSFDDDASYILAAKALLTGQGLTWHLLNGATVVAGSFPPGYSALLVPPGVAVAPQLPPAAPAVGRVLRRPLPPHLGLPGPPPGRARGCGLPPLLVLALGPPLATYGSMVMAETPFLVMLLALLLLVDRWVDEPRWWTGTGAAVVLAAAALVWLKEAGVGVVAGLCVSCWLLVRRRFGSWRKAVAVAAGVGVLLLPVVIARLVAGVPVAGSRYSEELGGYYQGGVAQPAGPRGAALAVADALDRPARPPWCPI